MMSLRARFRPPKRTRFSTSCVENRFSPVESAAHRRREISASSREVERIARLLEPAQLERRQRLGVGERLVAVEFGVGVDRELAAAAEDALHRLDAAQSSASGAPPTFIFTMV